MLAETSAAYQPWSGCQTPRRDTSLTLESTLDSVVVDRARAPLRGVAILVARVGMCEPEEQKTHSQASFAEVAAGIIAIRCIG
jgi:hypothetical protein